MTNSLREKTIVAAIWLFVRKLFSKIINLLAIAILARKLSPADFGIVALARVVLSLVTSGISQGTATYIVYDNSKDAERKVNTAFYLNIIFVLLVSVLMLISIPIIVKFYHGTPELSNIIKAFTLMFIFTELRAIPDAIMKKKLEYNKIVLRDTFLDVFSAGLSVYMAITGYGVWSLVLPFLISSAIALPVSFIQSKWLPGMPDFYGTKGILFYTLHVIGTNILTLLSNQGDKLITGKMLGFYDLGLYNRAFASANLTVKNIKSVIMEVSFPSLSKVAHERKTLRRAFIEILQYLSIIAFPISIFLVILAREFILVLYGNQWLPAVLPLQILSIMAIRRIVGAPAGTFFNAIGKPQIMFRFGLFFTPIYLLSVLLGGKYGIVGIATAVTLVRTLGGLLTFYLISKELSLTLLQFFHPMLKPLAYSIIAGLLVLFTKLFLGINNYYIALPVYAIFGIILYTILLLRDKDLKQKILLMFRTLK